MNLIQIVNHNLLLIPLFPILGAILAFCLGIKNKSISGWIATSASGLSFLVVLFLFYSLPTGHYYYSNLFTWFDFAQLQINFSFAFDQLTALMCLIITGIGTLIHFYSISYMEEDAGVHRFFSYLNLFLFSMLLLVLGSNLIVMFVGWEGVGLCSYLLIGFWYKNSNYALAGRKAFVVNRIGDAGVLLGAFLLFYVFGSLEFYELNSVIPTVLKEYPEFSIFATLAALGLFIGATGKSAQVPLFVWLPDAMAGPTPVSALIHAATMVTAGVYMLARLNGLFEVAPLVQFIIIITATLTAFIAAFSAITQNDIKKILAYSTVSQLGFMFLSAGAGAYWVALFHVLTHAFFKACLFLGAGSVIHGCHHEQDVRNMGGLWKKMPITFVTYFISTLAIAGIAPLSGYYSKHAIIESLYKYDNLLYLPYSKIILVIVKVTAFMTAFYMMRSVVLTFFGKYRGHEHPHESPIKMTLPLIILAFLAVVGGFLPLESYLQPVLGHQIHTHHQSLISAMVASWTGIFGVLLAYVLYHIYPKLPGLIGDLFFPLKKLSQGKFFFDEVYNLLIVRPLEKFSVFCWKFLDVGLVDGTVNASGIVTETTGEILRIPQTGQLRHYAFYIFLGTFVLTFIYLVAN